MSKLMQARAKSREALFPYSGSKARIIGHLPNPGGARHICEPFAGSLAYSAYYKPATVTCAESSELVRELLVYLNRSDPYRLRWIERLHIERVDIDAFGDKYGLTRPERTLVRLFTSGAYKGQLNSRLLYPQHRVNINENTMAWFRGCELRIYDDYERALDATADVPGVFTFVDPPYLGTHAGYEGDAKACVLSHTWNDGEHTGIMTYHERLPGYAWNLACVRKVPNMRKGGTTDRNELWAPLRRA